MKKLIFLLALLFATTFINDGRDDPRDIFFFMDDTTGTSWEGELKGDLYYTDLNGTTQYWSKTSPVGLDLNGAERVLKDSNSTFESGDTTDWTGYGTHTIDTSSTRKYASSYSAKGISGALGDTTTNYWSLSHTQFTPLVVGEKYTVEYWGTGVGKEGTATYTSNFGAGVDGWATSTGTMTYNASIGDGSTSVMDSVLTFCGNGISTNSSPTKNFGQNAVNYYKLKFWYLIPTSNDTITNILLANVAYTHFDGTTNVLATKGIWTYYSGIVKADGTYTTHFRLRNVSSVTVANSDSFYVANVSMTPIVQPTITAKIGSKSWTSDTLSIIPSVFEKVVYNFQATSAEVNTPIKMYLSQADTVYMDNFSITQAKDLMVLSWVKTTASAEKNIFGSGTVASSGTYYEHKMRGTGVAYYEWRTGGSATDFYGTKTLNNGSYHLVGTLIKREGYAKSFVDNQTITDSILFSNTGKMNFSGGIAIGARVGGALLYWSGQIGETQITTFDDISTLDKTPAQIYQRGKNRVHFYDSYTGGTIVGWWFSTATANDASGNGNNLTGTGSPSVSTLTTSY